MAGGLIGRLARLSSGFHMQRISIILPINQLRRSNYDMVRQTPGSRVIPFNRKPSWLNVDWHVLHEAGDLFNPLLERLKFLAISARCLDNFFEVRVADLLRKLEVG